MSTKQASELKQLQTRLVKAQAERATAVEEVKTAQKREAVLRSHCDELESRIKQMKAGQDGPVITEHALLRYFERVLGFDMEEVKATMLTEETATLIRRMGSGKYPGNACRLIVKDRAIVTVET